MKICVLGAGRMGSILGGFISREGEDVYLVDTWKEHIDAINENGLLIKDSVVEPFVAYPKAFYSPSDVEEIMDLVVVLCPGMYTRSAIEGAMSLIDSHTYVLTLQNGLGNVDVLKEYVHEDRILAGIVPYGGNVEAPGKVNTKAHSKSAGHFGPVSFEEPNHFMKEMERIFQASTLNITAETRSAVNLIIWDKLAKNSSGNPICGITKLPLGPYSTTEASLFLEQAVFSEVCAVAQAEGVPLNTAGSVHGIQKTSPMYYHYPSMAQDMMAKKPTEIDFINGAVVRLGEKHGIPTPYNKMLVALVKLIESNYNEQTT